MISCPVNKIMANFVILVEVNYGVIFTAIQILAWTCTEIINVIIHKQGGHLHMMETILTNFRREFKGNWLLTAIHLMVNHAFKILETFVIQLQDYIAQLQMELIFNMELIV